ncbi:hypothetical protein EGI22_05900 [Lacihabitans sp. LS3-19]|uniref:fibronectin type III domain-containing protein n=1 Tax=Lacihabitans sp. LS3-19 TaxID=2487335 RepID=UPI0020CD3E40|nr:fibronectin type III domain-containing protein [Lacihabitans sp. LS3-19]MCP9767436.1 hypothetical protein [Lacihabitans sp. LS3-19]
MKKLLVLFACLSIFTKTFAQIPPAAPTGLSGSQIGLGNQISLQWTAPVGTIAGYKVFYRSPSDPIKSHKKSAVATKDTLNDLVFNSTYTIYLKSFKIGSTPTDTIYSVKSDSVNVLVLGLVAPTPSIDFNLITHNTIWLRIDDVNVNETGFDIELKEGGNVTMLTENTGSTIFKALTGLKPKTQYSVRVRAKYNALVGPWSELVYGTTKVGFPPSPNLSSDQNCPTLVHLKWTIPNNVEDIQEYIIKKSFDNVNFFDLATPPITSLDYYDQSSIPGKTQFYKLFTRNITGSTPSQTVTVTALDYVNPNPPTALISDQGDKSRNHLTIKWTNGTEDQVCKTNIRTNSYVMVKVNGIGNFVEYANIPGFQSSIKIDNLKPKDIVEVQIFAVSDKGLFSTNGYVKDTTAGPPYAPSNMIAVLYDDAFGNLNYGLSWNDNSKDEDYFIIERSTLNNTSFQELGKINFNLTNFNDLTTEEGVIYYYRVKAGSNTEGDSQYSPVIGPFLTQYSKIPNAPYGLKAKERESKVDLTWRDDSIREENYIIEKSIDGGSTFILVATLGKNITSYTDENVSAGKTYIYRVKAVNTLGSSNYSSLETIKMSGQGSIPNALNVTMYPNPAFEFINIKSENINLTDGYTLKVYDSNNRIVLTKEIFLKENENILIPINNLGQGLFNVVISNDQNSINKKLYKY